MKFVTGFKPTKDQLDELKLTQRQQWIIWVVMHGGDVDD